MYCSEEKSKTKYNIVICEIYNYSIYGKSLNNQTNFHFIVRNRFKEFNKYYIDGCIEDYLYDLTRWRPTIKHKFIRNYNFITSKMKPEIAECIYLDTGEHICILKTFWIRIIQKTWKKIYRQKKEILRKRCHINALLYKERTGKWPVCCFHMPSIIGMLCKR